VSLTRQFRHGGEKGEDMLSGFKGKAPEKERQTVASGTEFPEVTQRAIVAQATAKAELTTKTETISYIGAGMSIVGKVECNGPAQIYGQIEGDLRASELLIGSGAKIEGNVVAGDVTVCGRVKGTIRAVRVKLQDGGSVEGDIFHRSLSIDENSLFEGSSRRLENPMGASTADAAAPPIDDPQIGDIQTPLPSIDGNLRQH
jgi:cytoskeletal protein CcmA (bactofilin family)